MMGSNVVIVDVRGDKEYLKCGKSISAASGYLYHISS